MNLSLPVFYIYLAGKAKHIPESFNPGTDADHYEIIGDDDGVFGCMTLLGCEDMCPKDLPHQTKIAYLRRKMVTVK